MRTSRLRPTACRCPEWHCRPVLPMACSSLTLLLVADRYEPEVRAQTHEQQRRYGLRNQLIAVKRRADPLFLITRYEAARRAQYAAQRAAGHEAAGDDHAALAHPGAALAAQFLAAFAHIVRQKPAHQRRSIQLQRQIHSQGEDQRRDRKSTRLNSSHLGIS